MKSVATLLLTAFAMASSALAASRRCYTEPFPSLLQWHIENEQECGLNNPHIVNFVCVPDYGLVPDATGISWEMAQSLEDRIVKERIMKSESDFASPAPSRRAGKAAQVASSRSEAISITSLFLAGMAAGGSKI